ncbi:MAG: AEC family transporter [Rhodospirillaceae bacterium]|jgi:malonate transporter and related proteins|nr:AEC family transporter [Rhodospirillaceae bacterium]
MSVLINIILPVFAIVGIGFASTRRGWISTAGAEGLGAFVFNFAIPAMLFKAMATRDMPDPIEWEFLIAYYGAGYIAWGIGMWVSKGWFSRDWATASVVGLSGGFANTVMLGLPLVHLAYGEAGLLPVFLIISFHSWQLFFVVTVMVEAARGGTGGRRGRISALLFDVVRGLVTNPVIMGLVAGVAWKMTGFGLPGPVDRFLGLLGAAAIPCSLFVLGASLARYEIAGALPQAGVVTFLKLVLHPLAAYVIGAHVFDLAPMWLSTVVIVAATPVGINVYMFGLRYDTGAATVATSILLSTLLSVVSLAGVLWLLGVR